jgi:hypothetical protein
MHSFVTAPLYASNTMGQAASRQAAKQVQKAASNGAKATGVAAPRPPPLGRPIADAPVVTEDAEKALEARQLRETMELLKPQHPPMAPVPVGKPPRPDYPVTPPQADIGTGFFRGQISDPRDSSQADFLTRLGGYTKKDLTEQQELAPDLLKFLQDAGPIEKKLNKVRDSCFS